MRTASGDLSIYGCSKLTGCGYPVSALRSRQEMLWKKFPDFGGFEVERHKSYNIREWMTFIKSTILHYCSQAAKSVDKINVGKSGKINPFTSSLHTEAPSIIIGLWGKAIFLA
jgi:hypothetical protein